MKPDEEIDLRTHLQCCRFTRYRTTEQCSVVQLGIQRLRTFHILVKFMFMYGENGMRFFGGYLVVTLDWI